MATRVNAISGKLVAAAWLALAPLALSACSGMGELALPRPFALSRAHVDAVSPGRDVAIDRFLPWAEDAGEMIVVDKVDKQLVLYRHGKPAKSYPVVLGRVRGRKLYESDRRTPSGLYRVTAKRSHAKYDRFLDLDYPNAQDVAQYRAALASGLVPAKYRGSIYGPGGLVGIHGSDDENLNRLGIDWTLGCVSLANRDIEDLYREVDEGTSVLIRDDELP
jgi:murein L,D-transpeptidase YafK